MPLAPTRKLMIPSRYAMSFDGVDDFVELPKAIIGDLETTGDFTILAWVCPRVFITQNPIYIEQVGSHTRNYLYIENTKRLAWDQYPPVGGQLYSKTIMIATRWSYTGFVQKLNAYQKIYMNGAEDASRSSWEVYAGITPNRFMIGVRLGHYYSNIIIGEILIYSRALSASEISWNYQNFYNPVRDDLVLCLIADPQYVKDIDGDGILEWVDLSGYNNHGKIYGATLVDLYKAPVRTLPAARTMLVAR
jgi:hypothetical protein